MHQAFYKTALILFLSLSFSAHAKAPLIELNNTTELSAKAKENQLPIMLMFSAEWCEYCEVLIERVLGPMMLNGMYDGKVMYLRHVGIDLPEPFTDWNGKAFKNKADWAYELNADLTPTVLFVDGTGKEIAQRIVGVSELTLFASLVHNRINQSYKALGVNKKIPDTPELLELEQKKMNQ